MKTPLTVALAGLGAVGLPVARWLAGGESPGLELVAVSVRDHDKAARAMAAFPDVPPIVSLEELAALADVVVECAPPEQFRTVSEPVIEAGKILVPLSVTQLLLHGDLVDRAVETGGRILVPTGALLGLDAVRAAAEGTIERVVMQTRKPPAGFKTAPFVIEQGINLDGLNTAKCLFKGSVRDAAQKFPANVNVAVALAFAGIGPDATEYEVWADPAVTRNTHSIQVEADSTRFDMQIAGVPTEENPATGKLTPLSVIATLKGLVQPIKFGT